MEDVKSDDIRKAVREKYGKVAEAGRPGCGCAPSPSNACCGTDSLPSAKDASMAVGYSANDVSVVPDGANMGLGCGNPQAIASLKAGEKVLDLGSGGGFDCFLAAKAVGETGYVIGVDMTPEMIGKARRNAVKAGMGNVEFRLSEIEALPVADNAVDVIISNCVINLSPKKERVFSEAFRVLKPGGRLAISDIVADIELPFEVKNDMALYAGCMAGASTIQEIESMLRLSGFEKIRISPNEESKAHIREWFPGRGMEDYVVSATIEAIKPMT
jgi:arsenite methyltransferase